MQLELGLELGKQFLPGLHRAVRGLGKPGEQFIGLGRAGQHEGSEVHCDVLVLLRCEASDYVLWIRRRTEHAPRPSAHRAHDISTLTSRTFQLLRRSRTAP